MARMASNERLEFVCQYCYAPIVLGRPSYLDYDKNSSKTSPNNTSPLKKSSSASAGQGANKRNLYRLESQCIEFVVFQNFKPLA